jgi:DNA (cytosine-5)-methyltransferase 1
MDTKPILSLFPGGGLLDRAFEEEGFIVVRGPDILFGGDVRRFRGKRGIFAGVIGGPPCQVHSTASEIVGTEKIDLIPEFLRVVRECEPDFSVMENVAGALNHPDVPKDWHPAVLRDWDCGGETNRKRAFWTWPFMVMDPVPRPGDASHSVMATTYKRGKSTSQYVIDKGFLPGDLPIEEYERLQGVPGHTRELIKAGANRAIAVHLLGNGVPLAMGKYIARAVKQSMQFNQGD